VAEVRFTGEAEAWLLGLPGKDQRRIRAGLEVLERVGSTLGRPLVDRIDNSRVHNLKEFRASGSNHARHRLLFAFDRRGTAIVLVGGNKTGAWNGWYPKQIERAEELFASHQRSIGEHAQCLTPRTGARSSGRSR
jgi:hypothetical protein